MATNSAVVGILRALLTADTAQFDAALKRSGDTAKAWSRDMKTIGQQASTVGSALTKTLTLPIAGVGLAVAKLAIDFESSFAGVRKTVNATEPEFKAMADSFRKLSKEIPVNVNELNRLGEAAGALGIPKAEIVDFSRVMALLGVTTNVTSDQAAESIAKIQNIFGAAGKDTEKFASTLVALGNEGASTESQILELANRIASAGNAVGLSQGQVLGFASAIANVGIEAEAGGSAISKVFIDISQAVSKGGSDLAGFASVAKMSSEQFATAFKTDAAGAIRTFIEGLGNIKKAGGDLNKAIGDLGFTEIRQSNLLRSLALSGDNLKKSLDLQATAWRDGSALTIEAGKRFETTEAQLTLLWNRVKDVGITIGNALKPAIDLAIAGADKLIPLIEMLGKGFAAIPAPLQLAVVGLAAVLAAAGPVLYIFGQLALSASSVAGAFAKGGIAAKALEGNASALNMGMTVLGRTVAAVAVAFVGWEIGKKIGEVTGLTAAIEKAYTVHGKWLGLILNDPSLVAAGNSDRLTTALKAQTIERAKAAGIVLDHLDAERAYQAAAEGLQLVETIRQAQFNKSIEAQAKAVEAELALGRISQQTANERLAALAVEKRAQDLAKNRVDLNGAISRAEQSIQKEIAATGYTVAQLTASLKSNETGFKAYAKEVNLSAETVKYLEDRVKSGEKADKSAETAKDKLTKAAEKQREALEKLGLVTRDQVISAVMDLADLEHRATAEGVPFKSVLTAIVPKLEDLAKQAEASGIGVDVLGHALQRARAELQKMQPLPPQLEVSIGGLSDSLKTGAVDLSYWFNKSNIDAELARKAMERLGIKSREELRSLAVTAENSWSEIVRAYGSGSKEATEAYKKMIDAQKAASGELPSFWQSTIFPAITGAMQSIGQSLSNAFAGMITGAVKFKDGFVEIWHSIKSAVTNILSSILNTFTNSFLQGMLGALMGKQGAFGQAFSGIFGKALSGGMSAAGAVGGVGTPIGITAPGATSGGSAAGGLGMTATGALAGAGVGAGVGYFVGYRSGSKTQGALAGAGSGAAVGGAIGGPIGAGVGAGIGALAGWYGGMKAGMKVNDLRDEFSAAFSAEGDASKGLEIIHEKLIKIGREDLFKGLAYGERNIDAIKEAIGKVQEAFVKTHVVVERVRAALAGDGLWDKFTRDAVKAGEAGGEALEGIAETLDRQLGKIAKGGVAIATALTFSLGGAFTKISGMTAEQAAEVESLAKDSEHELTYSEQKRLDTVRGTNAAIVTNYQGEFDRVSRITLASFNAFVGQGKSSIEAVRAVGPAIDELIAASGRFGFAGSAAFDQLARLRTLTEKNGPLLEGVAGVNELAVAFSNLGLMTNDVFNDLQAQGVKGFNDLTAAGFTETEALREMAPLLQTLIDLHDDRGYAIDEETQKLIDQAREQDILKDKQKDIAQVFQEFGTTFLRALGIDIPDAWKKTTKAAEDAARDTKKAWDGVKIKVPVEYDYSDANLPSPRSPDDGAYQPEPGAGTAPMFDLPLQRITKAGWGWLKPGDIAGMPSLTNFPSGEAISSGLDRSMAAGVTFGGGASSSQVGGGHTFNVYTLDTVTMASWLRQGGGRTMAQGIAPHMKDALQPFGVTRR